MKRKKMNRLFLIPILLFLSIRCSFGQTEDKVLYESAYNYLNSFIKKEFVSKTVFEKSCNKGLNGGQKVRIPEDLQVASKFIKNGRGFPLKDYVQKKYNFSLDTLRLILMGVRKGELATQVLDSLDNFRKDYRMKDESMILKSLNGMISDIKIGHQVFFSDIYKNTLSAEVMGFCIPYDQDDWTGVSTSFFFTFNNEGELEEVYYGKSIHYN